ncbi:MAG: hypothetical protein PHH84_04010 [Oscillospiraceae bacterium]|nr:hypothetical protein [Oscillospiraceae bacterium]MDD4413182.1 hypothetical protein [Oscillospiraceae bacterium]
MEAIGIKKKDYGTGIPRHEIEALARCLLPEIQKFFESEEGKKEFAQWKREQENKQKKETKKA